MTDKTTPITVHLTKKQMDLIQRLTGATGWVREVIDAVEAQRPRPIAEGDRVTFRNDRTPAKVYTVEATSHGMAWVYCLDADLWDTTAVTNLTRVDDETP